MYSTPFWHSYVSDSFSLDQKTLNEGNLETLTGIIDYPTHVLQVSHSDFESSHSKLLAIGETFLVPNWMPRNWRPKTWITYHATPPCIAASFAATSLETVPTYSLSNASQSGRRHSVPRVRRHEWLVGRALLLLLFLLSCLATATTSCVFTKTLFIFDIFFLLVPHI